MAAFHDFPYERWMENLPSTLHSLPMNYLAIPGSHDSFSYAINSSSKIAPDAAPAFKTLDKIFGVLARSIISIWCRTQGKTFTEQLKAGIRYLDLRVAARVEDKDRPIYLVHGMYSMPIREVLDEIKTFLSTHPKEVVLIDINHYYAMEFEDLGRLRNMLTSTFRSMLVPQSDKTKTPSLGEVWERQQQVILFFHKPFYDEAFWDGYLCPSLWPDTIDPQAMVAYNEERYRTARRVPNSFMVCQGILTPDVNTILANPFKGVKHLAKKAGPPFVSWVNTKHVGDPMGLNVCLLDYVEEYDFIGTVLTLNLKNAH